MAFSLFLLLLLQVNVAACVVCAGEHRGFGQQGVVSGVTRGAWECPVGAGHPEAPVGNTSAPAVPERDVTNAATPQETSPAHSELIIHCASLRPDGLGSREEG